VLTVPDCVVAELAVITAAAPAVPVAVKPTEPDTPVTVAVTLFGPAVVPSVQLPAVAIPLALVDALADTVPPPPVTAKFTVTPFTGFPLASVTRTLGGALTAVPATALCEVAEFALMFAAAPAAPVALKLTEPETPAALAVTPFTPAVVPRVHVVAVAIPLAFVLTEAGVTDPPPPLTLKLTATLLTPLPFASVTLTLGGDTVPPAVPFCEVAELAAMLLAGPTVPVAVKLTEPDTPLAVAVTPFTPAVVPNVQLVAVAMPLAFVCTLLGDTEPPPVALNDTVTPLTPLPFASLTRTLGGELTAVPAVAL
jgi:hypothetical protein